MSNLIAAGLLYTWYGWIDDARGRISNPFTSGSAAGCGLAPGQTVQRTWYVSTTPVTNWGCGDFRLKMDLLLETPAAGNIQFSAEGWSSYDVVIPFRYVGCAKVYLPFVTK
ncbi:MAG: hypothetical protein NZM11_07755 [Anaerolineales bacterium]|nr:hypothetical protein [Anaerolineales bacterium]